MLQTIREKLTGWFAVFILGAIALTLVVTFGNIDTGFSGVNIAATVNGEEIPMNEFRSIYQQQRQQWEANFRAQIPDDVAAGMADSVIQTIVRNRALAQHVGDQGYRVSDADIIESIQTNSVFFVGGKFSQPAYEQLLRSEGLTPQRFEYEQRQNMQLQQFAEGIAFSSFYTPAEFRRYIELDGERRSVEYALLSPNNWLAQVQVQEEAIAERYAANPSRYRTEDAVSLDYVEVNFDTMLDSVDVTEADAREYYDANPQEFAGPEARQASHILIARGDSLETAAQQAAELRARIDAGEDFAELAAQYSADTGSAANGGSLGWLGAGDAPAQEFEDALFLLAEGEISEPVQTRFGYHLIRLDGVREGAQLEFDDVRETLLQQLREEQAADRFTELLDELDERALESIDGLAAVATAMGLELKTVDQFTRAGGEPIGFAPDLIDTVFSLEVLEDGENSPVIALEEGRAVVVHVTEYRPSEVKPLDEVREEIAAEIEQEEAIALAAIAGAQLLDRLNAGENPSAVLAELGVTMQQIESLGRGDTDVPPELASSLFRAPKPVAGQSPYLSSLLASGEFAIYRVKAVEPGRPEFFTQEARDARKEQLARRLGGGQLTGVVETLVSKAQVSVVPNLLEDQLGIR